MTEYLSGTRGEAEPLQRPSRNWRRIRDTLSRLAHGLSPAGLVDGSSNHVAIAKREGELGEQIGMRFLRAGGVQFGDHPVELTEGGTVVHVDFGARAAEPTPPPHDTPPAAA